VSRFARRSRGADDAALARRAAAGDGDAFAALYERHEDRVYRLCHRILDSPQDAAEATRETFAPVRRGRTDFDVLRLALGACRRAGSEREREALALRELEGLAFDDIADLVGVDHDTVALLIVWARIPAASVLPSSACERALPLIARDQDGLLDEDSNEAGWLAEHLMHCRGCRLRRDALQPPGGAYRERSPIVVERGTTTRRHRGETALAGVLACVFVVVVLFGPASDDDMLGSPFPQAEEAPAADEPTAPEPAGAEPAGAEPAGSRPGQGRRGGPRHGVARLGGKSAAGEAGADRRRRQSGRPTRPADLAPAQANTKKDAPKSKRRVARGRVEHRQEPGTQEDLVPEVAPQPPPQPPPTETTPPPTETTPPPPPQ
jgi:hypothetical protein